MVEFIVRRLEALYLWVHRRTYRRRLATQTVFEQLYVVSIGNLSAGGTGKTPAALSLAKTLHKHKIQTLAVLRGYGGSASKSGMLVSDGTDIFSNVAQVGDEALLFARSPGLRVAIGRDRAGAILRFAGDARVVLLDDAFQNPLVGRDHELVLVDALIPIEKMRVFPGGRFRDPPAALGRADTILLTRADLAPAHQITVLENLIERVAPAVPVFRGRHRPGPLEIGPAGTAVGAFCGLGNPEGFFQTLAAPPYRLNPVITRAFADHHPYTIADIRALFQEADRARHDELIFITSAKDFVRLDALAQLPEEYRSRIRVLEVEFEILDGRDQEFYERVLGGVLEE